MAKTLYTIKMDFNKAKNQADQLENIAKNIQSLANNKLEDCLNGVKANWKGDNANSYVKKGVKVENNLKSVADSLMKVSSTMRQMADNTYKAEKEALELAKKRSFK
ncbi:MAG: WXG100 family type VII secretion target [Lachnospiraceae bacterium]